MEDEEEVALEENCKSKALLWSVTSFTRLSKLCENYLPGLV